MQDLKVGLIFLVTLFTCIGLRAQDHSKVDTLQASSKGFIALFDKKAASIDRKINKQTVKYLLGLEKQEKKLRKKLYKKDSVLATQLFGEIESKYAELKSSASPLSKYSTLYSGHLDSLTTALHFLKQRQSLINPELQRTLFQYTQLQSDLSRTGQIRGYLLKRQQLLKEQFQKLGMVKELKGFQKQLYYYQAQVQEYKSLLEDPSKAEQKLMEVVMHIPQFKDFFARNSILGSLFNLPGSNSTPSTGSLQGLQTRALVNQSLADRFGTTGEVTRQLQQQVQSAQGQLSELKDKLNGLSSGSYGNGADNDLPDFKPNNQKTKSFLQRLEVGTNLQSQRARYSFPVTSDIGLSIGYKLNDKSIIGVGVSYKLGWGSGWNHIRFSHQGVGLRSFVDYKLKGSLYISGGYEQNYLSAFKNIAQLRNYSCWQSSGLLGLSKRYKVSKKVKGEMKLLWDFLSYRQRPQTQPIVFRIGYSLK